MLGVTPVKAQDLGDAGLPHSGHFLHTGADVLWKLFTTQHAQLCAVALEITVSVLLGLTVQCTPVLNDPGKTHVNR